MAPMVATPASSPPSSLRRILGLLGWFVLLPSALTVLGAAWLLGGSLPGGDMRTAPGRVVGHETTQLHRSVGEKSVVEFAAHDGRTLRVVDSLVRQGAAVHKVGEAVTVRYPAQDPLQAEIGGSSIVKRVLGWALLLCGGLGMLAGWLLLRLRPVSPA